MPALLGGDCKMYYNSAAYDTPTWVEIDEVGDVSIAELNRPAAEVLSRASDFALNLPAKIRTGVEASYLYGANKAVFDYLLNAHLGKTPVDLAVMDGDITVAGSEGLRLITYIENFPIGQPLEEVATVDTIRFMAAYAVDQSDVRIDPVWLVVSGP